MLIAMVSATEAPGCTTAAVALGVGWPRPVVLADCNQVRGSMAIGFLSGRSNVAYRSGLASLLHHARRGEVRVLDHATALADEVPHLRVLNGFQSPQVARAFQDMWRRAATLLTTVTDAAGHPVDVIADLGRITDGPAWPVLDQADRVLYVVRPQDRSLSAAALDLPLLREHVTDSRLAVLLTGAGRRSPAEVEQALQLPVVGRLPADPRAAAAVSDGGVDVRGKAYVKSPLARAARELATTFVPHAPSRAHQQITPRVPARSEGSEVSYG